MNEKPNEVKRSEKGRQIDRSAPGTRAAEPCCEGAQRVEGNPGDATSLLGWTCDDHGRTVTAGSNIWSTLDHIAWDVYQAWAATGAADYFDRPWRGIWTPIGHPLSGPESAVAIACRIVGGWRPEQGYKGVAHESGIGWHRFVIIEEDGLVGCPCGGREIVHGYPCGRCGGSGRAEPVVREDCIERERKRL